MNSDLTSLLLYLCVETFNSTIKLLPGLFQWCLGRAAKRRNLKRSEDVSPTEADVRLATWSVFSCVWDAPPPRGQTNLEHAALPWRLSSSEPWAALAVCSLLWDNPTAVQPAQTRLFFTFGILFATGGKLSLCGFGFTFQSWENENMFGDVGTYNCFWLGF